MQSPSKTLFSKYGYDALDRLISNTQPNEPEHQRFYCKSRLVTEIQGATRYSIVQNGDQLLAQQQIENGVYTTSLLGTDQQRSVLQTVNKNHPPQRVSYSPYGFQPYLNALLNLLGFNGERPDPVTGCYLLGNGYRPFNPVLMRFTCTDSLSPFGRGGVNSYMYCSGDPINNTDPTGHFNWRTIFAPFRTSRASRATTTTLDILPISESHRQMADFISSRNSMNPTINLTAENIDPSTIQANQITLQVKPPPYSRWDPLSSVTGVDKKTGLPKFRDPPPVYDKLKTPRRRPSEEFYPFDAPHRETSYTPSFRPQTFAAERAYEEASNRMREMYEALSHSHLPSNRVRSVRS